MTKFQDQNILSLATMEAVRTFNDAFSRHDVVSLMAAMTEDCIFENTNPAPDGTRYQGQSEVKAFWKGILQEFSRCSL